jgi:glycerol-3-phosphate dehydrogenase (NAD(P)+)
MVLEQVAVIGAGSWGTALTKPLSDQGCEIFLWGRNPDHIAALKKSRENTSYLAGYILPDNVMPVADIRTAAAGSRIVLMVVPSHGYRAVFASLLPHLPDGAYVCSAAKGIENDTLLTMTQVMQEEIDKAHKVSRHLHLGVLSGPSFAREVAAGIPTAVTVAAESEEAARFFQQILSTERFRIYTSTDIIGLQLGGALKNIVAIAAGICDGLGYGTNTRAALITRGLAEISRLGVKMGALPLTFSGLGGLGDLVLTCTGELSRNRSVGLKLGQGKTLKEILAEMNMVAEGVKTTRSAWSLARKMEVEMPILEQVYLVLYEDKSCSAAVADLLSRGLKEELG